MGRRHRDPPARGIDVWPGGLNDVVDDAAVEVVRRVALALAAAVEQWPSTRSVANAAGLTHQAVFDLMRGKTWPEVATVVRLEQALGVRLWPGDIDPST